MNRKAIVTGGTKGIGKAVVHKLLSEGMEVLIIYGHDSGAATSFLKSLEKTHPGRTALLKADVTSDESVKTVADYIKQHKWKPDFILFNAGITDRTPFPDIERDSWNKVFAANLDFPVFVLQKLFPYLKKGSSVIFTGSLMGIHPHAVSLSYGVSKAAVHALVKNLVKFLSPKGIRVNAVVPGFVDTGWHKSKTQEMKKAICRKIASGRFSKPEELADIYWLVLNNPSLNGELIVADGGYSFA